MITQIPESTRGAHLEEERSSPINSSPEEAEEDSVLAYTPRESLSTLHNPPSQDVTRVNSPVFGSSANTNTIKFGSKQPEVTEKSTFDEKRADNQQDHENQVLNLELCLSDDESPLNWSRAKKWLHTILAALIFFNASFGSSSANSASEIYQREFQVNHVQSTLVLSIFILGYVFGPMLWAPTSEANGRKVVNVISLFLLTVFHMSCALAPNFPALVVLRFLAGLSAAAPLSNSGAFISDMWAPVERLWPMMTYTVTALMSPAMGPIAGGALSDKYLWREIYWLNCAMSGALLLTAIVFQRETYAPVLLKKKAQAMQSKPLKDKLSLPRLETGVVKEILQVHMLRPLILLTTEAPVIYAALWSSFCYSILFIFFEAYPIVFSEIYGFNGLETGLAFLGLVVGIFCSIPVVNYYNKRYIRIRKEAQKPVPEERLRMTIWSAFCYIVGFLWFGWTSRASVHWIVPIIGTVPIGSGLIFGFNSLATYTVELYIKYAASALAALAVSRSLFAFAFPLFSAQLFQAIGPGWACSILALISLIASPVPFVFNRYGVHIRQRSRMSIKD